MARQTIVITKGVGTALARSGAYSQYMDSIRKYQMLSFEEERRLLETYRTTTSEEEKCRVRNILLEANQRFIAAAAKQYSGNDTELFLDLVNESNIGFIEAIDNYDPEKVYNETKLYSWAAWYIRRACNTYLIDYGSMIRQSNKHITFHKLAKIKNLLTQEYEREPTDEELTEYISTHYKNLIRKSEDVMKMNITSIDAETADEPNSTLHIYEEVTANQNDCERECENAYQHRLIELVLKSMPEQERDIICLSYGFNEDGIDYSVEMIAEKLGCTHERVRQLKNRALQRMAAKIKFAKRKI